MTNDKQGDKEYYYYIFFLLFLPFLVMGGFDIYFYAFRFYFLLWAFNILPSFGAFKDAFTNILSMKIWVLYLSLRVLRALFYLLLEVWFLCHDGVDSIHEANRIEALNAHCDPTHQQLLDLTLLLSLVARRDGGDPLH